MMRATFFTQRKDIISGTETSDLTKEWPYLFETTGMKTHFEELTGVDMEDKNIATKCARVISFLKSSDKTGKMETIFREMETSSKNVADVNVAAFLPLLLKYFNEEEEQMFYKVDQTTLPSEVDCAELPSTPCIVVCGNSTLAAENFMLSADQTIVNSHISIFSDALKLMFGLLPYEHILPSSPSINFGVLTEVPLQDKSRQGIKSGAERHQKTTCSQSKGSHTDNQNCRLRVEGIRSAHKLWILCPSYRLFHSLYPVRFHVSYLLCSFVINVVDV
uniref:uncharacterized protein LOC117258213 isoform X2 n=1 Tax=Epinephelus lanceolatus TaxID=310571 RepID=UPI0014457BF7|nr:uncharacterized protein LOC117258213 isoform X2 [Epinephelus lanceolatus]